VAAWFLGGCAKLNGLQLVPVCGSIADLLILSVGVLPSDVSTNA